MTRYLDENSGKQIVIETNKKFTAVNTSLSEKANEEKTFRRRTGIPPIVSFLCDDGYVDDYYKLKPISELTGAPITLAIVTNDMNNNQRIFSHTHVDKLRELVDVYGYEATAHSADHLRLADLTYAEQENQLKKCKEQLEEYGFTAPKSIVYPYGSYNADTLKIAPKYYEHGYLAGTNTMNDSPIDSFRLGRIQFDPSNPNNNLEWYKSKVDEAVVGNKWVVFMLHCSPALGWMSVTQQQMLTDLILYTQSINVDIMTCGDAYDVFKNVYETMDGTYKIGAKPTFESHVLLSSVSTNDSKPSSYSVGTVTIERITYAYANTQDFPTKEPSILKTTSREVDYVYQEFISRNGMVYTRVGIEDVWSAWESVTHNIYSTQISTWSLGTMPAYSSKEVSKTVNGCTVNDFPIANPKSLLPIGLVFNVYINENDIVTVRVTNTTDSPIDGKTSHWAIKVIKS